MKRNPEPPPPTAGKGDLPGIDREAVWPKGARQPGNPEDNTDYPKKPGSRRGHPNTGYQNPDRVICGAKRRDGGRCRRSPLKGEKRCKKHLGKAYGLKGPASPGFKNGAHSRYLPLRYVEAYERSLADPSVLSLRKQLALIDAREAELIGRLSTVESGAGWQSVREAFEKVRRALAEGNEALVRDGLIAMQRTIEEGLSDESQWRQLFDVVSIRQRLIESEQRALLAAGSMISAEQVTLLAARFASLAVRYISDKAALGEFLREVNLHGGLPAPGESGAARNTSSADN